MGVGNIQYHVHLVHISNSAVIMYVHHVSRLGTACVNNKKQECPTRTVELVPF